VSAVREPVRFGVVGCADIAWRRTLPALDAEEGAEIVAIAGRSEEKTERFAGRFGAEAVHSYEALVAHPGVDAVYVPLPLMLHAPWTERALLAGKHVFVEKPLAHDHASAARLVGIAAERGLVLLENFMFLHHSQHAAVAARLADGVVGELRGFSCAFTIPPKPEGDIRYQPEVGGGALHDIGVYPVRAALRFLGPDVEVAGATLRRDPARGGVVLSGNVLLSTPSGVTAQLTFGMEHSYRTEYALYGSTGVLSLDRVFTPPASFQPVLRVQRQDHREEITLPADDQFAGIAALFVRAVREGADLAAATEGTLRLASLVDEILARARHFDV
jgi:NDP-hexose-3-ketoreductase